MSRFTQDWPRTVTRNDSSHTKDAIDKVYTILYYAHSALLEARDFASASKIDEVLQDYRLKGATLRYEYALR